MTIPNPLAKLSPTKQAWLAVAGAWLAQVAVVGPINAHGSYQAYYWNDYLPGVPASALGWIGSIQIFFEFSVAVGVGILLDAGFFKETLLGGSLLFVFSYFMLSLAQRGMFVPILLAQGFGMGIGLGCIFLPISGVVAQHFPVDRNLPLGIISTGAGIGGFAYALLTSKLFNTDIGFGWTVRIGAFLALGCLIGANVFLNEVPLSQRKSATSGKKANENQQEEDGTSSSPTLGEDVDISPAVLARVSSVAPSARSITIRVNGLLPSLRDLLLNPVYMLTITGGTLFVTGLFYPLYSLETFATYNGFSENLSSWILPMVNLSSLIGRTIPAYAADRIGRRGAHIMFATCAAGAGSAVLAMPACTSEGALITIALLYGLFQGAGPGLYFPTVLSLDLPRPGFSLGVASIPLSIGSLVGPPIAGALLGDTTEDGDGPHWWRGSGFSGAVWLAAALSMTLAVLLDRRRRRGISEVADSEGDRVASHSRNVKRDVQHDAAKKVQQ